MKKQRINVLLLATIVCVAAVSCQKESIVNQDSSETTNETNEIILPNGEVEYVIRERDSRHPFDDGSSVKDDDIQTKAVRDISRHVGETYKMENYPIACKENLGYLPVIDIDRYLKDYPESFSNQLRRIYNSSCSVYTSFDEYEKSVKQKRVIDADASVGYSVFKANVTDHYEKTFNTTRKTIERSAYGEFFKQWIYRLYELDFNTDVVGNPEYANYLSKTFLDKLHNHPPKSFMQRYGSFALFKYITGSQISIYYAGESSEDSSSTSEERTNSLQASIDASLKGADKDSTEARDSLSGGWETGNGSGSTHKSVFSNIKYWMTANGTAYGPETVETAQVLGKTTFDFSSWKKSLKDTTGFDIIQLPEKSLVPLSLFIEETNLSNLFLSYISGASVSDKFEEPSVKVWIQESNAYSDSYSVSVELRTRYADYDLILMNRTIKKTGLESFLGEVKTMFPYLRILSNKNIRNFRAEIEVSSASNESVNVKTYIMVSGLERILVREVTLPKIYVADYLKYEKERIIARYNRCQELPNISVIDLDVSYQAAALGYDKLTIENRMSKVVDNDFPILADMEDAVRSGKFTISNNLSKYVDNKTGKTYILDASYYRAYSLYDEGIIEEYFSKKFMDNLPKSKVKSVEDIKRKYEIYAL